MHTATRPGTENRSVSVDATDGRPNAGRLPDPLH